MSRKRKSYKPVVTDEDIPIFAPKKKESEKLLETLADVVISQGNQLRALQITILQLELRINQLEQINKHKP